MRARIAASVGLIALVAMTLAGCNFITPQATLDPYDPSDGLSVQVGDVYILNALILSDDGNDGNLVFSAVNSGTDDVDLVVQYEAEGAKVSLELPVAAGATTNFGFGDDGQLFLAGIDTKPGELLAVYFQYGESQGRQLMLPVLDGELASYGPYLPTPTPTPEPEPQTEESTPTPTPTP